MAIADELRQYADKVIKEGGMYYSGEYLSRIAKTAESLQAENAKLRERIHKLEMEGSDHFYRMAYAEDANRTLEAENAKLRELVQKMMRFFEDGDYCTTCEKAAECDAQEEYEEDCLMRGVFHDRMRELGIEVE